MGLDMFLFARRNFYDFEDDARPQSRFVPVGFQINSISIEAGYWRKANHIHQWFVENIQDGEDDCGKYYVERSDLETLRGLCKQVIDDPSKAEKLLPRQPGFFFGSLEYDDWYFEQTKETVEVIDKVLEAFDDPKWYLEYQSSW